MNWTNNAEIFNLDRSSNWNDISSFDNNQGSNMLITITDDSMYERYHQNDTVKIRINNDPPNNSDCLILIEDEVFFRNLAYNPDNTVNIIQTWPEKSEITDRDKVKILGYAIGILRT